MKVVLISPRGPLYRHNGGIWKKSLQYGPLTLTTLASLIPEDLNATIVLYDEGIQEIPLDIEADIIGISAITGTAPRSYMLADHFRKRGITVVLGGVHPTLLPAEAAQHADSVVVGYAEQTWPQLLRDFKADALKPMYRATQVDLRNLPLPRRDLLDKKNYLTMNVIEATRGCIHRCEFCVVNTAWGNKAMQKPVEDVIRDLKQMAGKRYIFIDLNLISDKPYIKALWQAMIPLKIEWLGLSTVQIAWDDELLELAEKSGCKGLLIGFESLSKDALLKTFKGFNTIKDYHVVVDKLHQRGIGIMACFVFGLDGDDAGVFDRTVDFCIEANIDLPRFAISTPFPSTPLYNRLEKEGRILTKDWGLYDGQHVVFQPKTMTPAELLAGTERAWKRVYSMNSIYKRLQNSPIKGPKLLAANLGYKYYAHNLHKFYTCGVLDA